MQRYDRNIREWEGTEAAHLIPAGQQIKQLLERQCNRNFLDKYQTWFSAQDIELRSAYVQINFVSFGINPDREVYTHHWSLQNIGTDRCPRWRLSTLDNRARRITVILPENKPLQPMLERCFSLHRWLIDRETLQQIVEG